MSTHHRYLLVLTEFPPRIGGMQTHALALAQELTLRGHAVEVATYRPSTKIEREQVPAFDAALPFPVHRVLTRMAHEENLRRLQVLVEAGARPDLVYASTVFYGELAERCDIPVVARSVGNDVMRPWIVYPFRPFARLVSSQWFEDRAYRFFRSLDYPEPIEVLWRAARRRRMEHSARACEAILANSRFTRGLLEDIGVQEHAIRVVVGGVDAAAFGEDAPPRERLGLEEDDVVLLTACRLVKKKAVDFLIDAMPAVLERLPRAKLIIVGGGREERRLRKRHQQSTAADRIVFAGRMPHHEVRAYFAAADVFVLASRLWEDPSTGLRDAETMGRVLCEANAAGLATVAARSGGIPSVIEDQRNGLLFEPDNLESFLDALEVAAAGGPDIEAMVARGQAMAREKFDWRHIVDTHEAIFADILEEKQI